MKQALALIAALVLFTAPVLAGGAKFSEVDANQDGAVSMEEAKAAGMTEEVIVAADANQDGQIDEAEFAALETE